MRHPVSSETDVEEDESETPMAFNLERWADALAVVRRYRGRALAIADDRIADLAADAAGQARWRMIRSRIVQIIEAALRDDQQ